MSAKLLYRPVCKLPGCRIPLVLAGMGGVARSELVAAVSAAGGFGFLGMVRESVDLLETEVGRLRALGQQGFGVNIIPAATDPALLQRQVDACIALEVPAVCLFWDLDAALVQRLREAGIVVVYQVGSAAEAVEVEAAGAQIIIAQGVEAGGHVRGTEKLQHLLPEVLAATSVPVLAAGGITTGADMATALALGAEGAVLGTAMIATHEAFAHAYHKQRLVTARAADTVLTEAFHVNWPIGAPVRVLQNAVTAGERGDPQAGVRMVIGEEEGRPIYLFSTDSPLRSMTGEFAAMALYAGMGVDGITEITGAGERFARIVTEAEAMLRVTDAAGEAREFASPVCYASEIGAEYMGLLGRTELLERLNDLLEEVRGALVAAPGADTNLQEACVRWGVRLERLVSGLEGVATRRDYRSRNDAGTPDRADVIRQIRALLPLVADDCVRDPLEAMVADFEQGATGTPLVPLEHFTVSLKR